MGYGRKKFVSSWKFYLERLARILPVYYFCFFAAVILIPLGYAYSNVEDPAFNGLNIAASFLLIQSWIMVPLGPNAPAWTVSTLLFFYLFYPR